MSRFHSYTNTAAKLIGLCKGDLPFSLFIKNFFSTEKKYGSKDRKQIAALCYNYFRIGFAMKGAAVEEKIVMATFLCEQQPGSFLETMHPEWNEKSILPIDEKLALVKDQFELLQIFPFKNDLSNGINAATYCSSMLLQPNLFLRVRPQCRITTLKKLERSKLDYKLVDDCIELPPATNAELYFLIDKEVVIQDQSSQKVLDYLRINEASLFTKSVQQAGISTWDCCAASGGKTILLGDVLKEKLDLTVSDIRLNIMLNLHQRFKKANIKAYKYFIEDIEAVGPKTAAGKYQLIICDAPCTGSGTWGRTPEQLCFFNPATIPVFSNKQKKIVSNVLPHLVEGGIFVYITCSVFREENETVATFIQEHFSLELLHQEVITGFDKKADTMFVSIFKN